MKRRYLFLALLPLLASCSSGLDAKAVDSADDFIAVASADQVKISAASSVDDTISGGEDPSAGVTSRAYYYSNDDYRIETASDSHIGYTLLTDNGTYQYCLINSKQKSGTIYANASALDAERALTVAELRRQYNHMVGIYDMMKGVVGKSAADLGYESIEFRRSIAPEVAGYVLLINKIEGDYKVETNYYLMMDKVGDVWAFTNYNVRSTYYALEGGKYVAAYYKVSQYQVTVVEEYSKIPISLSGYSLTVEGLDVGDVSYDDGPLTQR